MKRITAFNILLLAGAGLLSALLSCGGSVGGDASVDGTGDTDAAVPDSDVPADPQGEEQPPGPGQGVDILVVVDNSGSMSAEQEILKNAFPALIRALLDPPVDPETGQRVHEPIRDLHLGVISTDLGTAGFNVQTCEDNLLVGDDAILQHAPNGAGCGASYPLYLDYSVADGAPPDLTAMEAITDDFGCIAALGTSGCGFEQQLEAARRALLVQAEPGGPNDGFLRADTIVVILFITDEEDCSAQDPTMFDISSLTYGVNLRCYYEKSKLFPVSRYAADFRSLRSNPDDVVVGMIVGVPPIPGCNGRGSEISGCLDMPAMQEIVRPDLEMLEYVCKYPPTCNPPQPPNPGDCATEAFPARRFVELALNLGEGAIVQSICTGDYVPPMSAISARIAEILTGR